MKKLILFASIIIASCSLAAADTHIKYLHPDGSLKAIYSYEFTTPEQDIAFAVNESFDANNTPYHVIIGENLHEAPTHQSYYIVASSGVLICQNILNP